MTTHTTPTPSLHAIITRDEKADGIKIAALTLLDRLVVAVHRAGVASITLVSNTPLPSLKRSVALGVSFKVVSEIPPRREALLMVSSGQLLQAADLRALLHEGGRLMATTGEPLPAGLVPPGDAPWMTVLGTLAERRADGVAFPVCDEAAASRAEKALWASLTSSSDGWVDRVFNRPCGRYLSKLLIFTAASPNAVSLVSIAIGVAAAACFAMGGQKAFLLGAVLFQLSAIVDCVDGDLARILFKESPLGKWLDLVGDQVVHLAVFAGIAAGLLRGGGPSSMMWLGASAIVGASLSFAVVLRGMRRPAADRSRHLQKLIDAATNRDFSVLVLVLAMVDLLEWFLWMSAIGSHLFWMTALALQSGGRSKGAVAR